MYVWQGIGGGGGRVRKTEIRRRKKDSKKEQMSSIATTQMILTPANFHWGRLLKSDNLKQSIVGEGERPVNL